MSEHRSPNIAPCNDSFGGRLLQDYCKDCDHALAVHRSDRVCSVCDAVAHMKVDIIKLQETVTWLVNDRPA